VPCREPDWLKERVFSIQDRTVSIMIRAGIRPPRWPNCWRRPQGQGRGQGHRPAALRQAKEFYEEAFYRVLFIGAENSIGFHNRRRACASWVIRLRSARGRGLSAPGLTKAGVDVPIKVDLEIMKYVDQRGTKKLKFDPTLEVKDPTAAGQVLLAQNAA